MKSGVQPQPSAAQQEFLEQEQFHKRKVATCRIMLLVLLLAIWELCARLGIIDDFIFSSPSRVFFCFRDMVLDGSIFGHIGITLFETIFEARARYLFIYAPAYLTVGMMGLHACAERIKEKRKPVCGFADDADKTAG